MGEQISRMWSVKGCLATGAITLVEVRVKDGAEYAYSTDRYSQQYRIGRDIFDSEDDARSAARILRDKKVASIAKQTRKLESMSFPAKEPRP